MADINELKTLLAEVEKNLNREKFGLERYKAQVAKFQQELADLDNTGFFSFLVDMEAKKREAQQELTKAKEDLQKTTTEIAQLEARMDTLRGQIAEHEKNAPPESAAPAPQAEGSEATQTEEGEYTEVQNGEAILLVDAIISAVEVANSATIQAVESLSASRMTALMSRKSRALIGGSRRAQASGSNIEMALEVLRERVAELESKLMPVINDMLQESSGPDMDHIKSMRESLFKLKTAAMTATAPANYSATGLGAAVNFSFDEAASGTTAKVSQILFSAQHIKQCLEQEILLFEDE